MEVLVCSGFMTYVDITNQNIFVHTFLQAICLQKALHLMAIISRSGQVHLGMAKFIQQFCKDCPSNISGPHSVQIFAAFISY